MKSSELRKLVSQYHKIIQDKKKKNSNSYKLSEKIKEIEHRYYHETGRTLKSDLTSFQL